MNRAIIEAKAVREEKLAKSGADLRGRMTDDWLCAKCGASCFASRQECYLCETPRNREASIYPFHSKGNGFETWDK